MKYFVVPFGAIAIAIVLMTMPATRSSAAPKPTPTAVAIGYDEIGRSAMMGGTPPPPGQFMPDYQAIMATVSTSGDTSGTATPTPAPKRRGLGGLAASLGNLGNMGGPGGPGGAMGNPMAAMDAMKLGTLKRYTYYWRHGWVRVDDPVQQTATIEKCNEHEFIYLNLAKKTYRIENTTPKACDAPASPFGHGRPGAQPNMEPGTSVITINNSVTGLGPKTLESIPTQGYAGSMDMSMTEATGSCTNANMKMDRETYYSEIGEQRAYCPIAGGRASGGPEAAMAQGGCKPTMHMKNIGSGHEPSDRLFMYQRTTMDMQGHPFSTVTERGHVDWYLTPQADALFSIPPGFTKESSSS